MKLWHFTFTVAISITSVSCFVVSSPLPLGSSGEQEAMKTKAPTTTAANLNLLFIEFCSVKRVSEKWTQVSQKMAIFKKKGGLVGGLKRFTGGKRGFVRSGREDSGFRIPEFRDCELRNPGISQSRIQHLFLAK